jgi:hypothetical protein
MATLNVPNDQQALYDETWKRFAYITSLRCGTSGCALNYSLYQTQESDYQTATNFLRASNMFLAQGNVEQFVSQIQAANTLLSTIKNKC